VGEVELSNANWIDLAWIIFEIDVSPCRPTFIFIVTLFFVLKTSFLPDAIICFLVSSALPQFLVIAFYLLDFNNFYDFYLARRGHQTWVGDFNDSGISGK
jgi:hypothetical protein